MKPRLCDICKKPSYAFIEVQSYPKDWPENVAGPRLKVCTRCLSVDWWVTEVRCEEYPCPKDVKDWCEKIEEKQPLKDFMGHGSDLGLHFTGEERKDADRCK